jgi:hypothetical protein
MKEVLAGIVASCQPYRFEFAPEIKPRLLLRPKEEWETAMVVGASVRLCLPNGKEITTKIKGFEIPSVVPKGTPFAILIEEIPGIDNHVPAGTKVFVNEKELPPDQPIG